ncbi:o-succinylbenzoate--CoA ligase [Virgibacillus sp. 179-BFC.A HS]|uniref:2-succinylbenzoate--CoA ligase n=1 Tax=Tigheibacillus jepli TaxID=3035914 RepID=A0ABU5CG30_9BACI|nr:o-succinylbenzoate--CoA ligase [Virgibacillus sp. 179-BFC.A HS]MDY0405272.1 o-succinylbenzoate--CoA ligase [Virgibacillus sp. 179-BFC.A HS]
MECEDETRITFSQLKEECQQLAQKLANLHINKGDHIAILSPNDATMIKIVHALSYLGAVAVLLNTKLTQNELQYQIVDADVKVLLYHESQADKAEGLHIAKKCNFSKISGLPRKHTLLQEELHLDDPFTIIYTSGTTGFPKGVVHTYGNHWWSAIGSALNLGLSEKDKWLAVLPYFHVGGLSIFMKNVIYGMPVYLMEKFDVEGVHRAIMEKGITIISVVTVMVQRLLNYLGEANYPKTLRCMLLGGGPAPISLLKKAQAKHIPIVQSYGMTETSSQIVTLSFQDALRKVGSSGKALFPAQVKINKQHEDEAIGEIIVKGPMVTKGYYNREETNEKSFAGGWLATGDLGYLDEEGFLYVVDRRNDLIISGGENIYPTEVENALASMSGIREAGVVGKKSQQWGQVPVAFVALDNADLTKEKIIAYLKDLLAPYKIPKEIVFVEALPRNASNKLWRSKMKEWVEN